MNSVNYTEGVTENSPLHRLPVEGKEAGASGSFIRLIRPMPLIFPQSPSAIPLRSSRLGGFVLCVVCVALVFLTACATAPPRASASSANEQVRQRLTEIFHAAETKDLPRLDSYHWYGPHFTKFAGTGPRLDAAAAREGEHKGLSALAGLKLTAENLQIDVFHDAAIATFTMVATIQSGPDAITKRERGTLVLVQHEGSWKIVHEHFSAVN
jgi:ketosteroid isomerase-like protein